MKKHRLVLPVVAGFLLALVIACGGGDDKAASGDASAPVNAAPSGSQPSGGGTTSQVLDLASTRSKLLDLRSFRFDMALKMDLGDALKPTSEDDDALGSAFAALLLGAFGDIKAEGAFVAPDSAEMKLKLGGMDVSFVQIGDKAWVRYLGAWQEADPESDLGFGQSPTEMFEQFLPAEVLKGARTSRETMNGQQTTRYAFDKKSLEELAEDLGEDAGGLGELSSANLDVWLTDEDIPVKVVLDMTGKDEGGNNVSMQLTMNVRDINADIKIKPPV